MDRGFAELLDCLSVSVFSFRDDPCVSVFIRVPMKFFGRGSAALGVSVSHQVIIVTQKNEKEGRIWFPGT